MSSSDSHISMENENIFRFPVSFPYFDYLLSYPPALVWISSVVLIFGLIQQYITVFVPIVIASHQSEENTFFPFAKESQVFDLFGNENIITNVFLALVQYDVILPQFSIYDARMLILFLPTFFLILLNVLFYYLYLQNHEISPIFCQLRCFLFLFVPSMSLLPITVRVSFALKAYFYDEVGNTQYVPYDVALGFIFIIITGIFIIWTQPLISHSPILGNGHVPSHLVTDFTFFVRTQLLDIINVSICILGNNDASIIFFLVVAFFNGIYKLVIILRHPFLSVFHSAAVCSVSITYSATTVLCIFVMLYTNFTQFIGLLISIGILVISFIVFYYIIAYLEKVAVDIITSEDYTKIKTSSIPKYLQIAVTKNILESNLIEYISGHCIDISTPQFLISRLICEKSRIESFTIAISALIHIDNLMFSQKFLVYQIYLKYMRNSEKTFDMEGLERIENRLIRYKKSSDDFWTKMLKGKINDALKNAKFLSGKMTKLFREYNLYYQACPQQAHVAALNQDFFYNFVGSSTNDLRGMLYNFSSASQSHESLSSHDNECGFYNYNNDNNNNTNNNYNYNNSNNNYNNNNNNNNFNNNYNNNNNNYNNGCSTTSNSQNSDATSQYSFAISQNLKKVFDKHIPISLLFLRTIGYVCFILFLTASLLPIFQLSSDSSVLLDLSPALNHSLNIALAYSNMNMALGHAVNCTFFINANCNEVLTKLHSTLGEPPTVNCYGIQMIYDELVNTSNGLLNSLNDMTNKFSNLTANNFLPALVNAWFQPTVSLFPDSEEESINSIKVDINSLLLRLTAQVRSNYDINQNGRCSSSLVEIYRNDAHSLFNISSEVQLSINQSLNKYFEYTNELQKMSRKFFNTTEIIVMIIFGIAGIIIPPLWHVLSNRHFYHILKKYFRPSSHPNLELSQIERQSRVDPFKTSNSYFLFLFVWVLVYILSFVAAFLFSNYVAPTYDEMINESKMLICMQRLALYVTLCVQSLLRAWQFPGDKSIQDFVYDLQSNLQNAMDEFYDSLSPELIKRFKNTELPLAMKNQCGVVSRSNHDIYRCWNFMHQCELFFFIFNSNMFLDWTDITFTHLSHLYSTHMSNDFISIGDSFTQYALGTRDNLMAVLILGIIVYFLIVLVSFIIFLAEIFSILHIQRQISRLFLVLSPFFIAQNECLMEYVVEDNKSNEKVDTEISTFQALYEKAEIALILINDHLTITSFTKIVQSLFSYRAEQLIGQQIDLLFPKLIENNDLKLYQHLSIVKRRQAENTFTRTIIGRLSDGEEIPIKVKVTGFTFEERLFFVMECKSVADLYMYDELILSHTDVFNEICQSAMPTSLFKESLHQVEDVANQHFDRYSMVYVFSPIESDDLDSMKAQLVTVLPYFNGNAGGVVLYCTNVACLMLFVDEENYIPNALHFFVSYGEKKCGFIVEGEDLDLVMFPPPQVPEEYKCTEMPIDITQAYSPSMTIEPMSNMLSSIPYLVRMCKQGKLLCTEGVLSVITDAKYQKVNHYLNSDLYYVDLEN